MNEVIQKKLDSLPKKPGVYQHKDGKGKSLYIGKAKNLRSRVRSYFQESRPRDGRLGIMLSKVEDIEIIVTETEAEALILENNLIKEQKPRYNINLRDDKSYPYVCVKNEPFPRVFPTRRVYRDGSKYYGPFTNAGNLRFVLKTIRTIFKLRTCNLKLTEDSIAENKFQSCLEYHIKKCAAPCIGLQSEAEYLSTITQIDRLLNGRTSELIRSMKKDMDQLAKIMEFEEAALLRDQITAIEKYSEKQRVVINDGADRDIFSLVVAPELDVACGTMFQLREGKVIGRQHKYLRNIQNESSAVLRQIFVERYYAEATFYPEEIMLDAEIEDDSAIQDLFEERTGKRVQIKIPERGDKAGLVRLVTANANLLLDEWKIQRLKQDEERIPHAVKSLQTDLRLQRLPRRIECFDISHLGGTGTVASCVVFVDGKPRKSEYRSYIIKSVEEGKPDDFLSMREVVERRYARIEREGGPWPDLVVIDGGKGQLSSSVSALQSIEIYGEFPVVGLAKRLEEVFFPFDQESVRIPKTSTSLQLLQKIRNEAHRFAVALQRKQRTKSTLRSELTEIRGIGEITSKKLIKAFGSVAAIQAASDEQLRAVVGAKVIETLRNYFLQKKTDPPPAQNE